MKKELLVGAVLLGVSSLAFSYRTRREIGERDNWTCQNCGKSFQNGWHVQAAHYDHDKKKKKYDDASNGRILCTSCHIKEELDRGDIIGANLLKKHQTIYTFDRLAHPENYRPKRRK